MKRYHLKQLWELYKEYCDYASKTQLVSSNSAVDFLSWLKVRLEKEEEKKPLIDF